MNDRLERQDIEEKRAKCAICGHVLTFCEYLFDNKCAFCVVITRRMTLVAWIRFSVAEYRVYRKKLAMANQGLTVCDFEACVGQHAEDIGKIRTAEGMNKLLKELKDLRCQI